MSDIAFGDFLGIFWVFNFLLRTHLLTRILSTSAMDINIKASFRALWVEYSTFLVYE